MLTPVSPVLHGKLYSLYWRWCGLQYSLSLQQGRVEFSRCWYDLSCFGGDQRRRQSGWSYLAGEGGHSPTIFTSLLQGNAHLQCSRWSGGCWGLGRRRREDRGFALGWHQTIRSKALLGLRRKRILELIWLWKIKKPEFCKQPSSSKSWTIWVK